MLADVGLELTFPDGDAVPAHGSQLLLHLLVALPVAPDLADPELAVCLRNITTLRTLNSQLSTLNWWHCHPVPVPEASVHENTGSIFPHHNVGLARQPRVIQPIAKAMTPQPSPHHHLRLRVLAVNGSHVCVSLLGREGVTHILSITACSLQCSKNSSRVLQKPLYAALAMPNLAGCSRLCQSPTSNLMRIG